MPSWVSPSSPDGSSFPKVLSPPAITRTYSEQTRTSATSKSSTAASWGSASHHTSRSSGSRRHPPSSTKNKKKSKGQKASDPIDFAGIGSQFDNTQSSTDADLQQWTEEFLSLE